MNKSANQAQKDIILGIKSDIVHKYIIDNAPDIISLIQLYQTSCELNKNNSGYLFGFLHLISHTMVNPSVINNIIDIAIKYNGNFNLILDYANKDEVRRNWNTSEFHQEMKAVAGNYKSCGGFLEDNIYDGIAHSVFSNKEKIFKAVDIINNWLKLDIASEDDFIKGIFELQIPGMDDDIGGYWILHFCRGVSLIRQKVLRRKTNQSILYLDMIGVRLFREKYDNLCLDDMTALYEFCKNELKDKTDVIFTYGDFGCLCCEMHRLIDEFKKNKYDLFREKIEYVIYNELQEWLFYKNKIIRESNFSSSTENSARSNVNIFIQYNNNKN
jgi:hypothetical protein